MKAGRQAGRQEGRKEGRKEGRNKNISEKMKFSIRAIKNELSFLFSVH